MNVIKNPLPWAMDHLESGRRFGWSRWGDGEWTCMLDPSRHKNANGCFYVPALRDALRSIVEAEPPGYHFSTHHRFSDYIGAMVEPFLEICPPRQWYYCGMFSRASKRGELRPLIEWLHGHRVMYVGPEHLWKAVPDIFGSAHYICAPSQNAWEAIGGLCEAVLGGVRARRPDIIGLSCGLAAEPLLDILWRETDCHIVDFGSVWDPYAGVASRGSYRTKPQCSPENIRRMNLS